MHGCLMAGNRSTVNNGLGVRAGGHWFVGYICVVGGEGVPPAEHKNYLVEMYNRIAITSSKWTNCIHGTHFLAARRCDAMVNGPAKHQ